jgi:hypothetical protein
VTKWLEKKSKELSICNAVVQNVTDGIANKAENVELAYKFYQDFAAEMSSNGTNKRLQRMIEEKTLSFGPKRKGPNMLINKYLKREESFFAKIISEAVKFNLAES